MRRGPSRPLEFKKSVGDSIRASQAALGLYAESSAAVPDIQAPIKRPRAPRADYTTATQGNEAQIQYAVLAYLKVHPRIAFVGRFNSGAAVGSYNGVRSFIRMNSVRGFSDLHGMLRGGRALYVECKSFRGKLSPDQAQFIDHVNAHGGLAFVATCVEDVEKALASA